MQISSRRASNHAFARALRLSISDDSIDIPRQKIALTLLGHLARSATQT
jgi:hypothetical protein